MTINVHSPSTGSLTSQVESFTEKASQFMQKHSDKCVIMFGGDLNAKTGKNNDKCVELFGLESDSNERGDLWTDAMRENNIFLCNSFYKHRHCRTRCNMLDSDWHQTDGFRAQRTFRSRTSNCKSTQHGVGSYHLPAFLKLKSFLPNLSKSTSNSNNEKKDKTDCDLLKDPKRTQHSI